MTFKPWTFFLVAVAGWMNRQQQEVISYLTGWFPSDEAWRRTGKLRAVAGEGRIHEGTSYPL
jgi:hypothetical protein